MERIMSGSIPEQGPEAKAPAHRGAGEIAPADLDSFVDPRWGDVGDDSASPKQRSLIAIAGSLLVEISLPKLVFAVTMLLLLPAALLGIAPLVATAWATNTSSRLLQLTEISAALTGIVLFALGMIAWRPLLRVAEVNFWSLNALAVQPAYALCREALQHVAEHW